MPSRAIGLPFIPALAAIILLTAAPAPCSWAQESAPPPSTTAPDPPERHSLILRPKTNRPAGAPSASSAGSAPAPSSAGTVLAAPTAPAAPPSAATSGTAGATPAPTGRGFTNLLSKFPELAPTLKFPPAPSVSTPAPSQPSPQAPAPTAPVPIVSAPPPANSQPAGVVMGSAVLTWNPNREPDLAGYKIYVGTRSGAYDYPGSPFVVGNLTTTTISNLPRGQTYFFSASAYDHSGNESALASEVSKSLY